MKPPDKEQNMKMIVEGVISPLLYVFNILYVHLIKPISALERLSVAWENIQSNIKYMEANRRSFCISDICGHHN